MSEPKPLLGCRVLCDLFSCLPEAFTLNRYSAISFASSIFRFLKRNVRSRLSCRLPNPRIVVLLALLVLLQSCNLTTIQAQPTEPAVGLGNQDTRPNIVLINLDDADSQLLSDEMLESCYPNMANLAGQSIRFTNMHVTTPFCGPSRACLFRGQYAHNTGIKVNNPESKLSQGHAGGYQEFKRRGFDQDELGVWMKRAGYHTIHLGKFHHHGFDSQVPPGWNDFYVNLGARYYGTCRFTNRDKPEGRAYNNPPDEYIACSEASDVDYLIQNAAHRRQTLGTPFLFYYAPFAPHRPVGKDISAMVDHAKYGDWQPPNGIPKDPDLFEADVSDKPSHLQFRPVSSAERKAFELEYLCRTRSLKSVDDVVGRIVSMLESVKELDNTVVILTSDNGYQLGHHGLNNKMDPYDRTTRAPLFVKPASQHPNAMRSSVRTYHHLLAHIDICPTILELGEAQIPEFVDGRSFLSLVQNGSEIPEQSWQQHVLIENWGTKVSRGNQVCGDNRALRMFDSVYVEWGNQEKEFYDLKEDPFQLENRFHQLPKERRQLLHNTLVELRFPAAPANQVSPSMLSNTHGIPTH